MRTKKESIPYENNAEQRTTTGWCCKTCDRFWGQDENMARWCCATDMPCECGLRTEKHYTKCAACRVKLTIERFLKLEAKPYDGSAVVTYDNDKYLLDESELIDYIAENLGDCPEHVEPEDFMLVFADCRKPKWHHSVGEILGGELYEDCEWDTSEIDGKIEEWVNANAPDVYWPTKVRVDFESVRKLIEKAKADA